ncbi:MAG: hypothetical protein K0Q68_902 [Moraxellaceae bacterium]|jgi:hypothetical protein|nr:hypothetical protein [Moraxellaceae bacterium]
MDFASRQLALFAVLMTLQAAPAWSLPAAPASAGQSALAIAFPQGPATVSLAPDPGQAPDSGLQTPGLVGTAPDDPPPLTPIRDPEEPLDPPPPLLIVERAPRPLSVAPVVYS